MVEPFDRNSAGDITGSMATHAVRDNSKSPRRQGAILIDCPPHARISRDPEVELQHPHPRLRCCP
jgi:hypothetical protein